VDKDEEGERGEEEEEGGRGGGGAVPLLKSRLF
jgi:hypothetical protein